MLKIYDFTCADCGVTHEDLVASSLKTKVCPECGGKAQRIISGIKFQLDGTDPSFPGAYGKWADDRMKRVNAERKRKDSTGDWKPSVKEI